MPEFWTILPNLGTAGIAIAGLVYVVIKYNEGMKDMQERFIATLDSRSDKHNTAMQEREVALRDVERAVRNSLTEQLTKNTVALLDVAKILGRVTRHLDGEPN